MVIVENATLANNQESKPVPRERQLRLVKKGQEVGNELRYIIKI